MSWTGRDDRIEIETNHQNEAAECLALCQSLFGDEWRVMLPEAKEALEAIRVIAGGDWKNSLFPGDLPCDDEYDYIKNM